MNVITHEQAIQIAGTRKKLECLILDSFSDELGQLFTGAKFIAVNRLGAKPVFGIITGGNGEDVIAAKNALNQGKVGLLNNSRR